MRHGFGVHSSLWGPSWTPELAARAIDEAKRHKLDILEIALLDPASVDAVLRDGAERARAIADPVIAEVQEIVGFLRP